MRVCVNMFVFKNDDFSNTTSPSPAREKQKKKINLRQKTARSSHSLAKTTSSIPRDRTVQTLNGWGGTKKKVPIAAETWGIRVGLITTWMLDKRLQSLSKHAGLKDAKDRSYRLRPDPAHSDSPRFM